MKISAVFGVVKAKIQVYLPQRPKIQPRHYPDLFKTTAMESYQNRLKSLKKPIQAGTCSWVEMTREYKEWICRGDYQLLWLTGNAGMGKSTLAAYVISKLRDESENAAVIHVFCADTDTYSVNNILCAAIYQLIGGSEILRDVAIQNDNTYSSKEGRHGTSGHARRLEDLWDLFSSVVKGSDLKRVYLVIDGLDNCQPKMQKELMALLNAGPEKLRVLVTSQPLEDLRLALWNDHQELQQRSRVQRLEANHYEGDINSDIGRLLQTKISEIREKRGWREKEEQEALQYLSGQRAGIFLPFVICLETLEHTEVQSVKTDLKGIFNNLKDLDATYEKLMKSMSIRFQDKPSSIMNNVIYTQRPLTVRELGSICGYASEIAPDASTSEISIVSKPLKELRQDILLYGPMLRIKENDDTVDFIHPSAKKFLIDQGLSPDSPIHRLIEKKDKAQLNIASYCISTLQSCSHETYPSYFEDYFPKKLQSMMGKHDFLSYAFEHWRHHVRMALSFEVTKPDHAAQLENLKQLLEALARVFKNPKRKNFAVLLGKCGDRYIFPRISELNFYASLGFPTMVDEWLKTHKQSTSQKKDVCEDLFSALQVAIGLGDPATSVSILECLNIQSFDTAQSLVFIFEASQSGDEQTLRRLLALFGRTSSVLAEAAITACFSGHGHLLRVLGEESENLFKTDKMKMSVLHRLATHPAGASTFNTQALLEAMRYFIVYQDLNPNEQDLLGHTVLHHLCWDRSKNNLETIRAIVQMGADSQLPNRFGCRPIHLAACRGNSDLLDYLIERGGADAAMSRSDGNLTPLHWAMSRYFPSSSIEEEFSILRQLLCNGASLDMALNSGRTPISIGCENPFMLDVLSLVFYRLDGIDHINLSLERFADVWAKANMLRLTR